MRNKKSFNEGWRVANIYMLQCPECKFRDTEEKFIQKDDYTFYHCPKCKAKIKIHMRGRFV